MKKMKNYQASMTPEQRKTMTDFNSKSKEEQAEIVVKELNRLGVTKEQLSMLYSLK